MRLRIQVQVTHCPRRALVLTDTPHPDCSNCGGWGGIEHPYGDHNGDYAGSDIEPCGCWNETRRWPLLPLPRRPRWLYRRRPGGYSDEPPF